MKVITLFRNIGKRLLWVIMAIVLLIVALLSVLYSAWGQEILRQYLVKEMNKGDMSLQIESLRLRFPLDLQLTGLELGLPGAERISARSVDASVSLWPLLTGHADISTLRLDSAAMTIGAPDSAMMLSIAASTIALANTDVALATMNIDVKTALIDSGSVDLLLNPIPSPADTAAAAKTSMRVDIHTLQMSRFGYTMRMLPTIDSLSAQIPDATATEVAVDLNSQIISLKSFTGDGLSATYLVPDSATIAATPVIPPSTSSAEPWTVTIDTIGLSGADALYTTRGVKPLPGLDFTYIAVDSLTLSIKDFYNQATVVRVPLSVSGRERCGVELAASGTLDIDSVGTRLNGFDVSTPLGTQLNFNALIGMGDMTTDPATPLALNADGYLSVADARLMFPSFMPYLVSLPASSALALQADVDGTAGDLNVQNLTLNINKTARLHAEGHILNAFDPDRLGGNLALSGNLINLNGFKSALFDRETAAEFNFPPTSFDGRVNMNAGRITGRLQAVTQHGKISLDADWNLRLSNYDVHLRTDHFPINAFMPLMGVGQISATLNAKGHGYNLFAQSMSLDADLDVTQAVYDGYDYRGISANAHIADGHATANVKSTNPNALFNLDASGNLVGDTYDWAATLDGDHIDLMALGLSKETAVIDARFSAEASITPDVNTLGARLVLSSLDYTTPTGTMSVSDVVARLNANDSVVNLSASNGDMYLFASSTSPLDTIMARATEVSEVITQQIDSMTINVDRLQRALPQFRLDLTAGSHNAITDMMADSKTSFANLHVAAANDSSLSINARMLDLRTPSFALDTITFDVAQYADRLILDGTVENAPGTFDEWAHVRLDGFLDNNRLGLHISQHNIAGKQGYDLGLQAELADSAVTVSLTPTDPIIGYMPWTVNEDNFIRYSFAHKHIDADLHMHGDRSSLAIYTNHIDGHDDEQEALTVQLTDIRIADWIKLNPFAPPMDGLLSADISVSEHDSDINGDGTISLTDFTYNRQKVADIQAQLGVTTDLTGRIRANADLMLDGQKAITLSGALNDSTASSPLAMDLSVIHFPLSVANPFIGPDVAKLSGVLNGSMAVTGTGTDPHLNGWLQFDSTAVRVTMLATDYHFNNVKIPVDSNIVRFNDFEITGANENPLTVNGAVDITSFASPQIDLTLAARDFQLCNTKRAAKGADIYGKGFVNLNTTLRGNTDFMAIDASVTILAGTNITYVMTDAENVIANRENDDMVKFVNFADTAAVNAADSLTNKTMAMLLNASLTIQTGSTINVDLSTNGRNRVSLQPDGTVDMTMQPFSEPRLTGRINIPKGFVRYTPPFLSEKLFNFEQSSYVSFNGDMMNPNLNIHAIDELKANVTQSGQNSRLVNFDVHLDVTGTLSNMNVAFNLTTDDDITVANELQSMSAEQRANQAMNMLLYNVYTGPGTRGDSNLSGNALYSFLSSQLNNWAANTIKGVDLTFGIDQYDRTVGGSTSQTTSYSYQVSKSLFNDRFKIVVGGNYSTDANADENFSQNLIKDISFEYFLNKAQTMYLRLFRHTGYESILEGEITRTGVGFVYKRKISNLKNLFRPFRRRKSQATQNKESQTAQTLEQK